MAPCVIHWFSTFTIVSLIKLVSETQKYTLLNSQSVESENILFNSVKTKPPNLQIMAGLSLIGRTNGVILVVFFKSRFMGNLISFAWFYCE